MWSNRRMSSLMVIPEILSSKFDYIIFVTTRERKRDVVHVDAVVDMEFLRSEVHLHQYNNKIKLQNKGSHAPFSERETH